jgi:hypothetical protein
MQMGISNTQRRTLGLRRAGLTLSCMVVTWTLAACAKDGAARPPAQESSATSSDIPSVLATVGDQQVTLEEVRNRLGTPLAKWRRSTSGPGQDGRFGPAGW